MPNNETFQINKFQMKICEKWDTPQLGYIPSKGEPIYVTATIPDISTPIFVIGDGSSSLTLLVSNKNYFVHKQSIPSPGDSISEVRTDGSSSAGSSTTWARSDHEHALGIKITSGMDTDFPKDAKDGDIFILIEDNA